MYRDVTQITNTGSCIAITDDKTLTVYSSTSLDTYTLVSDKYMPSKSVSGSASADTSTHCYTIEQIQQLPSQFDFMSPIYTEMAIFTFLAIMYGAYRLIIYPFFRKI